MKIILKDHTEMHVDLIDFLDNNNEMVMTTSYVEKQDEDDDDEIVSTILIKNIDRIEQD